VITGQATIKGECGGRRWIYEILDVLLLAVALRSCCVGFGIDAASRGWREWIMVDTSGWKTICPKSSKKSARGAKPISGTNTAWRPLLGYCSNNPGVTSANTVYVFSIPDLSPTLTARGGPPHHVLWWLYSRKNRIRPTSCRQILIG